MADKDSVIMYRRLSDALDDLGWKYERDDMRLKINTSINCGGQTLNASVQMDDNKKLIYCYTQLNFEVEEEFRKAFSQGVCMVNMLIRNGSFDFSPKSGKCAFRMTSSYRDSIVGKEVLQYILLVATKIIDLYNAKLFMLATGKITLDELNKTL